MLERDSAVPPGRRRTGRLEAGAPRPRKRGTSGLNIPIMSLGRALPLQHRHRGLTPSEEVTMKWTGAYLIGFIVFLGGVLAALWKIGFLERIGPVWTIIGIVIAIGLGIMIAVANSGREETIQIEK